MKKAATTCSECLGPNLYSATVNSAGGYGPQFLPGLGGFFHFAKFNVVVCGDCGLTRFYAEPDALKKLPEAGSWRHL